MSHRLTVKHQAPHSDQTKIAGWPRFRAHRRCAVRRAKLRPSDSGSAAAHREASNRCGNESGRRACRLPHARAPPSSACLAFLFWGGHGTARSVRVDRARLTRQRFERTSAMRAFAMRAFAMLTAGTAGASAGAGAGGTGVAGTGGATAPAKIVAIFACAALHPSSLGWMEQEDDRQTDPCIGQ
jgi:hypothetical protein